MDPSNPKLSLTISAPGKVILHGEHSVVYNKLAIAGSLGLRTKATICEVLQPSELQIKLLPLNFSFVLRLPDLQAALFTNSPAIHSWESPTLIDHDDLLKRVDSYILSLSQTFTPQQTLSLRSILYLFTGLFSCTKVSIQSFGLTVDSELTLGAGCGSSASFAVTIAAVFIQYIRLKAGKDLFNQDSRLYFEDPTKFGPAYLEIISKWAYLAEKITHGTPSGIDNTICTYGSTLMFRKNQGHTLLNYGGFTLLLINTKVQRNTKLMVEKLAGLKNKYDTIISPILDSMEEVSVKAVELLGHLVATKGEEALKESYTKLGEVTDINQNLLRSLGVSHHTLDKICAICKSYGLCGKLTGAGGGGYAIAIVPPYFTEVSVGQIMKELEAEGFEAILTSLGGDGVRID